MTHSKSTEKSTYMYMCRCQDYSFVRDVEGVQLNVRMGIECSGTTTQVILTTTNNRVNATPNALHGSLFELEKPPHRSLWAEPWYCICVYVHRQFLAYPLRYHPSLSDGHTHTHTHTHSLSLSHLLCHHEEREVKIE